MPESEKLMASIYIFIQKFIFYSQNFGYTQLVFLNLKLFSNLYLAESGV